MAGLFFAYNEIIPIHTFPKGGLAWIFAPGKAMKICHSVRELIKVLEKGTPATLVVYGSKVPWRTAGIWGYSMGDTLTLNVRGIRHGEVESRITYCSWPTYQRIKKHLTILPCPCPEEDAS